MHVCNFLKNNKKQKTTNFLLGPRHLLSGSGFLKFPVCVPRGEEKSRDVHSDVYPDVIFYRKVRSIDEKT